VEVACYEDSRDLTVQEVVRSIRAGRMLSERDAGRGISRNESRNGG
jgi:hypothetical protein